MLNDFQKSKFFEYAQLFFGMIEVRGFDCLWDQNIYCCASVHEWQDRLMFIAAVEPESFDEEDDESDEEDDESPCLFRPNVEGRAVHYSRNGSSNFLL